MKKIICKVEYDTETATLVEKRTFGEFGDPACIVNNMGRIVAEGPRLGGAIVSADIDILAEPKPQYRSELFYPSHSMRKTRLTQRRPETYKLASKPLESLPLYKKYFG